MGQPELGLGVALMIAESGPKSRACPGRPCQGDENDGEAGGNEVGQIIELCSGKAQLLETFGLVADHGVHSADGLEGQRRLQAQAEGRKEQIVKDGREDGVHIVLGKRLYHR